MPSATWYTGINAGEAGALPIGTLAAASGGTVLQSGGGAIFTAWGGGVLTQAGVYVGSTFYPGPALVAFGGGHTDYSGNELYAIVDLQGSPFYARLRDKSSPDVINADSNGGGDPVARHPYQAIQAIDDGTRNWLFSSGYLFRATDSAGSQVCHYFDFNTPSPNTNQPWSTKASHPDGACDISVYDAANGRLWAHAQNLNEVSYYTVATDTWTSALFKSPLVGTNAHSALDPTRNLWFAVWSGATTVQGFSTADTALSTDFYSVSTAGTAPPSGNNKSIVYDPVDDRFVVWPGGNTLYFLTPPASSPGQGGNAWTWSSKTFPGATAPAAQTNGTFGRAVVLPAPNRGYLVWADSVSAPVFLRPDSAFAGPAIEADPQSVSVNVGSSATFTVASAAATSFQWQDNTSGSFADVSGATSSSLTVVASTAAMDGRRYRCNCTNVGGTHTSNAATLTLRWPTILPAPARAKPQRPIGVSAFDASRMFGVFEVVDWFAPELANAGSSGVAAIPGVSAGTQAGTVTASGGATATLVGVSAGTGAGTVIADAGSGTVAVLQGVAAGASAGVVQATGGATATLVGVAAGTAVGTVIANAGTGTVAVLQGVAAAAAAGVVQATGGATAALPGVAAATGAGTVIADAGAGTVAVLQGVAAAAAAGVVQATGGGSAALPGVAAATGVGTVIADAGSGTVAVLQGVAAAAAAGVVQATGGATAALPGVRAITQIGTVIADAGFGTVAVLNGVQAGTAVGTVQASGGASAGLPGVAAATGAGVLVVDVGSSTLAVLLGVRAGTQAGVVTAAGGATAQLVGVRAGAAVGVIQAGPVIVSPITSIKLGPLRTRTVRVSVPPT